MSCTSVTGSQMRPGSGAPCAMKIWSTSQVSPCTAALVPKAQTPTAASST
jgi:hypothetical protein